MRVLTGKTKELYMRYGKNRRRKKKQKKKKESPKDRETPKEGENTNTLMPPDDKSSRKRTLKMKTWMEATGGMYLHKEDIQLIYNALKA